MKRHLVSPKFILESIRLQDGHPDNPNGDRRTVVHHVHPAGGTDPGLTGNDLVQNDGPLDVASSIVEGAVNTTFKALNSLAKMGRKHPAEEGLGEISGGEDLTPVVGPGLKGHVVIPVLEELTEAMVAEAGHLFDLGERLSTEGFTMELALEADRVLPELHALDTYFSTTPNKRELALEGILGHIWDVIVKFFQEIWRFITTMVKTIVGAKGRAEEVAKKASELETADKELQEVSHGAGIDDLNGWLDKYLEGDGKHSNLAHVLSTAPWQVREFVGAHGESGKYGTLLTDLAKQSHNVELYLTHGLMKQLHEMRDFLHKVDSEGKFPAEMPSFIKLVRDYDMSLPTLHHGAQPLSSLMKQRTELASMLNRQPSAIELYQLRLAIHTNHSFENIQHLAKILAGLEGNKELDPLLDEIMVLAKKLSAGHHSGEIAVPAYHAELTQAITRVRDNVRSVFSYFHVMSHDYVDMAGVTLDYWVKVVRSIVQSVKATGNKLHPIAADTLSNSLDKKI